MIKSDEHAHSIETSGQEGSILPYWGVACYSKGFTGFTLATLQSKQWKQLRVSYVALTSCSDLHFNIQFIESAHFLIPLYVYLGCL